MCIRDSVYGFRHTNAHADHHGDQAVRVRFTRLPCTVAACMCVRAGSLVSGGADIVIAVPSVSPICTVTRRARRPSTASRPVSRASGGLYRWTLLRLRGSGQRWISRAAIHVAGKLSTRSRLSATTPLGVLTQTLRAYLCVKTRSAVARANAQAVESFPTSKRPAR
eukprot:4025179-Prymnesium_polylepis.1